MPWVEFLKDTYFRPPSQPRVTIAYKAGDKANLTRAGAKKVIDRGRAKLSEGEPAEEAAKVAEAEPDAPVPAS